MYAIVDIETTGGHASANGITEIAIVIHDGNEIVSRYETLVNPMAAIPVYIRGLTGITEEMVASAPEFREIAGTVFELLDGKVHKLEVRLKRPGLSARARRSYTATKADSTQK